MKADWRATVRDEQKNDEATEAQLEDLDVDEREAEDVKGGVRKAGGCQPEYLKITLTDVLIS